jgi:hypothetical protein
MSQMLSDVQALAGEIGPRGTGTPGEKAAADWVTRRLTALGLPVERQSFRSVASQNAFPLAIDLVALFAAVVYPVGWPPARWLAAGLALATAPLLWHTIRTSSSPLRPLLPHVTSQNVVTRIEPQADLHQRVVLLAHLDTNRCRVAWQSSMVRYLEPLAYLTLAMLTSLGLLYTGGALFGNPGWVWWVSLLPAGYVAGTIITLWKDDQTAYTCGAHDNAASVAVTLEVGARLAARPLLCTQVWLAFTGGEETDHAGLYALLRQCGSTRGQALFVGLEGLGSGELVYLTRQGLCAHYRPDPGLLAVAEGVATTRPELDVSAAQMTMEDEVGTLRRAGYRAICLAGRDPATGALPHWHRPDDTVDTVSGPFLERAADWVMACLHELDRQAWTEQEIACAHS